MNILPRDKTQYFVGVYIIHDTDDDVFIVRIITGFGLVGMVVREHHICYTHGFFEDTFHAVDGG